jgi:hypothetical protein
MRIAPLLRLVIIQLVIALVLLELGLRILYAFNHQARILLHSSTAETRYDKIKTLDKLLARSNNGFKPDTEYQGFVLNSKSFRTREYSVAKPPGNFRIITLGDSFTFASGGTPYIDHWTTRLEHGVSGATPGRVEVLNLGVSGVGLQFELRLWQLEGRHLEPDLVIVGLFVGNDFMDDAGRAATAMSENSLSNQMADAIFIVRAVRNLSRLYSGVVRQSGMKPHGAGKSFNGGNNKAGPRGGYELVEYREAYDPMKPSFTEDRYVEIEAERMEICLRDKREHFETLFDRVRRTLTDIRNQVAVTGADFMVMIIPDEYQVNPEVTAAVLAKSNRTLADYELNLPQRRLAEFFEEEGIEYLDLLPAFISSSGDRPLYRLRNTHWTMLEMQSRRSTS